MINLRICLPGKKRISSILGYTSLGRKGYASQAKRVAQDSRIKDHGVDARSDAMSRGQAVVKHSRIANIRLQKLKGEACRSAQQATDDQRRNQNPSSNLLVRWVCECACSEMLAEATKTNMRLQTTQPCITGAENSAMHCKQLNHASPEQQCITCACKQL
jgi:hypothetical protein